MTEGVEAAADAVTGAVVAATVEPQLGAAPPPNLDEARACCRNCGAVLTDRYCAACGQPARIHRSLASLGHDILHFVFHFEGKLWRTLPELVIYPGRLTRRYIEGERAKFISPMALYLFSVFLMYAVFSFTGGTTVPTDAGQIPGAGDSEDGSRAAVAEIERDLEGLRQQLGNIGLAAEERSELEQEIRDLEASRDVAEAFDTSDFDFVDQGDGVQQPEPETPSAFESRLKQGFEELKDNPGLTSYKLKTNGYKYSWALVPLSIPFIWLLFFWRRDIHAYDHAVFVTYSISFMMLLLIFASLLETAGARAGLVSAGTWLIASVHLYRQLRGAYGLSRRGALVRLFFLLIAAGIVLIVFMAMLLVIGALD